MLKENVIQALKNERENAKILETFCDPRTTKNLSKSERIMAGNIDLKIRK
jgi:hypothetical protein